MGGRVFEEKIIPKIEFAVIIALQVLAIVLVVVATINLFVLLGGNLIAEVSQVASVETLLPAMQRAFAGILIVVLGLELLETLKTYFIEHHVRLEVILIVAIIAVGRHVIQIDFEHSSGPVLMGLSAVILSLTFGYFLVRKAQFFAISSRTQDASNEKRKDSL
jgi:uncharacterized membrane protein (DUF373 family)